MSRVILSNAEFARSFVDSMVKGGFMYSWGGDRSEPFRQDMADTWQDFFDNKDKVHINHLGSAAGNLRRNCGWTEEEVKELIKRCRFVHFQFDQVDRNPSLYTPVGKHWALAADLPPSLIVDSTTEIGRWCLLDLTESRH
jgi:hypothetical protein